jgi:hypothetical protein
MEEVILIDGQILSEVIIPTMNIDRFAKNGLVNPEENHKSQIYVNICIFTQKCVYENSSNAGNSLELN